MAGDQPSSAAEVHSTILLNCFISSALLFDGFMKRRDEMVCLKDKEKQKVNEVRLMEEFVGQQTHNNSPRN